MSYHYLNNLRLQLWFDTPNVCAVFLVMTVMLTIGAQMFLSSGKTLAGKIPSVLLALAAAIQLFMLAMTYSRGGYIAIAAALTLAALLAKNRRVFIAYGAVFALSLLLVNNGLERVNSMADVAEGSILHRLWLWRGGLGIIADHPLGVPAVEVGRIYSMWYKPLWLNEEYFSLINDYLTVAAVYGLLALFICLTAVFTVAGLMRYYLKGSERDPAACLLGALAGYLAAAFFSTFYVHLSAIWLFAVIFAGALAWVVYGVCRRRLPLKKVDFIAPAAAAFLVCLGIFIAGCVVNSLQSFSHKTASLPESEAGVITCIPKKNPGATIIYFYENDVSELNREKIRSVVRPLLEHGYHVIAANIDVGLGGLAEVAKVLDMARRDAPDDIPLVLLGSGHAARLMVIGAADHAIRPAGILALDLAASWPWEELSPDRHLHKLKVPLKLIWRKESPVAGVEDMRILQKSGEENNLDLTVSLLDAEEYSAADLLRAIEQTIRPGGERKKPASAKIAVEFFYRDGCKECEKVKTKVLPMLEDQFSDLYELHYHNLADGEKYLKLAAYQEYFRSDSNAPVSMVVNSSVLLSGYDEIAERLCREVEVQSKQSPVLQNDAMGTTDQADLLSKRVARFSLIAVAIAGFIDGINPCVFGALIFFISLLFVAKIRGRKLLAAGLVYCLASFLTYLALGFGILNFLKLFSGHHVLRNLLEIGTIAVLFLLALFSLGDAIRFKASGRAQSMKLQLPDRLKMKMRQAMKRGLQYKFLLPGIFGIGVLVTVLESVCTGQIYIPTLVLVTRTNGIGIAFFYLLVYNIFFIIPLLLVFWMAYKGAAIMSLIRFSKRQAVLSKLTMSVFFVSLGIFMLFIRNI